MAEKLSINIDLRQSRHRIQSQAIQDDVSTGKIPVNISGNVRTGMTKPSPVEYRYHYDRIFVSSLLLIGFIIGLILLFSHDDTVIKTDVVESKATTESVAIKEKHLTIASDDEPHSYQQSIFLLYDEINIMDTFEFPIVITQEILLDDLSLNVDSEHNITESPTEPLNNIHDTKETNREQLTLKSPYVEQLHSHTLNESSNVALNEERQISNISRTEQTYNEVVPVEPHHKTDFIKIYSDSLSRVMLVSNIYKKEPVNKLNALVFGEDDSAKKVYLFTQLDDSTGKKIEHQWWFNNKQISSKSFTAQGKRWRCYSSKNLGKLHQGDWMLKVIDQQGKLLSSINFTYKIR